ncbi:MAG TPA: glycosyltransferase [Candidatus Acidoferrales bacterium]|nr:glycosyltransferase [Candidatus Acidoferrales bacterium]
MKPILTIGIPVCNGMPFLAETLQSVQAQTCVDFEILAIDDGSKDDSREYLLSLRDPRLRVISQPNQGLTATLNRMLEECRTPWLARLDADDIALPHRLARISEAIGKYPEAGMFYSRAKHHDHANAVSLVRSSEGSPMELREQTRRGYLLSICHSSVVLNVRKTLIAGGYRFNYKIEDLDLWWRMALRSDIVFVPEVTVAYRLNAGSMCINNLREVARNTLFVQYLLLSHLRNRTPMSYAEVRPVLDAILDERKLRYRQKMWDGAACLSKREYRRAALHLAAASMTAPGRFLNRCAYPLRRNKMVRVGESPARFEGVSDLLWPAKLPAECETVAV